MSKRKKRGERRAEARALNAEGFTVSQIAERIGITISATRYLLRTDDPETVHRRTEAIRLRAKGLTLLQISARIGITGEAVRQLILTSEDYAEST